MLFPVACLTYPPIFSILSLTLSSLVLWFRRKLSSLTMGSKEMISVIVKGQDGREKEFRVRPDTPMDKLMARYCEIRQLESGSVQFLHDGSRIERQQTPAQLKLKDRAVIDAMVHQFGGGCKAFLEHVC